MRQSGTEPRGRFRRSFPGGSWRPDSVLLRLAIVAAVSAACSAADTESRTEPEALDLAHFFRGTEPIEATFVILDDATGAVRSYDPARAARRVPPASTFKIPNSLIALETGVASGPDFFLPWDSTAAPTRRSSWARDQTMRSAFRNSVLWYYQELARRTGPDRMRQWLDRLEYGAGGIGAAVDQFWLNGDLRISANEQVEFLRRFHRGELDVSARSIAIVRDMMLLEDGGTWRLFGKTGTSGVTETRENGWIVGFAESPAGVHIYALNMEGETVWEDWPPQRRAGLARDILLEIGVLPPASRNAPD
jgi:beta-lactamase class D